MIDFLVGPQLLTPLAQKVTDVLVKICKDFKADVRQQLRDDINSYIGNFVNKFSKIKTFLYSDQRKDFYEVYFPLYLCHPAHRDKRILVPDNPDNLFAHNNYVTILGHAGCGKTMILRHLFLSACNKSAKIPLVVELRKLKDFDGSFADYISDKVFHFKITQNSNIAQRMLKSGEFIFLLDGYDEIAFAQKDKITHELEDFVDQYPDNYYFLTSRPGSGAETLERFDNLHVCGLTEKQVMAFIDKQFDTADEEDKELAAKIKVVLAESNNNPYIRYMSSPLLLSMFILTYNEHPELPRRKSSFYYNVFDTLHSKHDAKSKAGGYQHEKKSKLSQDDIKRVLEAFCFISYMQSTYEFSEEYLYGTLSKILKLLKIDCNAENLIYDLNVAVSLLVQDGTSYVFPHRSLQEYFAASYIANSREESKRKIYADNFVKSDRSEGTNFWELCEELDQSCFTQYFLIPKLNDFIRDLTELKDKSLDFSTNELLNYIALTGTEVFMSAEGRYLLVRRPIFYCNFMRYLKIKSLPTRKLVSSLKKEAKLISHFFENSRFHFDDKSSEIIDFYRKNGILDAAHEFVEMLRGLVKEKEESLEEMEKDSDALIGLI